MIKRLRYQFILISMSSVGVIFCFMLFAINISMTVSMRKDAVFTLQRMIESQEQEPSPKKGDIAGKKVPRISNLKRTTVAKLNDNGQITAIIDNGNKNLSKDEIRQLTEEIYKSGKENGMVQENQFLLRKTSYGYTLAFMDCSHELENTRRLVNICLVIGILAVGILMVTVIFLSNLVVNPIEEGFQRQKQFVADASHELKTPLSVISANVSVLEDMYGENQWTSYVQTEIERMSRLINDMLKLVRMEQPALTFSGETFDFSKMAMEVLLPYECLAYEQGKQFMYEVEPGLKFNGSRDSLTQMLHIFVDNAFKYSEAGGEVKVTVKKIKKKICIKVYNTGEGISEKARKQIFQRFYREEDSHNRRTEGYGLGLSIAQTILDFYHGKVNVMSDGQTYASFEIQL